MSGAWKSLIERRASMKLSRVGSSMFWKACSSVAPTIQLHWQCGNAGGAGESPYCLRAARDSTTSGAWADAGVAGALADDTGEMPGNAAPPPGSRTAPGLDVFEGRNQLGFQFSCCAFWSEATTSGTRDIALKMTSASVAASSVICASTDVSVAS